MENQNNLTLNDFAVDSLRVSAKWSMFLSIIGFIGIGFMIIAALFMYTAMSAFDNAEFGASAGAGAGLGIMGAMKGLLAAFYVVIAVIYFFPVYYLFKYATGMKQALNSSNSDLLSDALGYLKSHHKFLGIMTIVIISLYIITIIGTILFAASMASGAM